MGGSTTVAPPRWLHHGGSTTAAPPQQLYNCPPPFAPYNLPTTTELTSACVTGLVAFRRSYPGYRQEEVERAIGMGVSYVRAQQRPDGSWYGSWAVCFTYGAWFGVEALVAAGDPTGVDAPALRRACAFLLSVQRPDGGWGESYLSCLTKSYTQGASNAVATAWALLALVHAQCEDAPALRRGVEFLLSAQTADGDWPQEGVTGIFNRTCSITYTAYRNVFPLWALAAYEHDYSHRGARGAGGPSLEARQRGALAGRAAAAAASARAQQGGAAPRSARGGRSRSPAARAATPTSAGPASGGKRGSSRRG